MNKPNFVHHEFWATRFYACGWQEFGEFREALIAKLYALKEEQSSRIASRIAVAAKSDFGIYESDFDFA